MSSLADFIEQYLRGILIQKKMIELQRRELAKMFRCAPSQINYVLETRFNLEHGFIVESKRGGGGYIRITQVSWRVESFPQLVNQLIPERISDQDAEQLLIRLVEEEYLQLETAQLAIKLMEDEFSNYQFENVDYLRAMFLRTLLIVLGAKTEA